MINWETMIAERMEAHGTVVTCERISKEIK
jgi:hypothetical protein